MDLVAGISKIFTIERYLTGIMNSWCRFANVLFVVGREVGLNGETFGCVRGYIIFEMFASLI